MATYQCRTCGITKNDTLISKMSTPTKCKPSNTSAILSHHSWSKIANEDL